jgi:carboxypeptidase Taq
MTTAAASAYRGLVDHFRQASLLQGTAAILSWDQETMMPAGGVEFRGEQLAQLAGLVHRMKTDPRLGDLLEAASQEAGEDPLSPEAVNVREWQLDRERAMKLPESLVEEMARVSSVAQHEWAEARRDSDFAKFKPWLEKLLRLSRQQAECLGWNRETGEPWDALGDLYEPGLAAKEIEAIFTPLGNRLKTLIAEIADAPKRPDDRFDRLELPEAQQEAFVRFVAEAIGFDFTRGRLDRSTHPFCGGSHRNDVRLTTRFRKDVTLDALGSTMHECGHGIYEQGLPAAHLGTPMGEAASLSVHESQSRLWENQVGRSGPFWEWLTPKLDGFFGSAVAGLDAEAMYGAANRVQPGFIRVEADEATYNLHIMIRFDLERRMLRGDLAVADLPAAWNEHYREALGLEVPDDRRGCLQDVHWSMGAMGYFPTYTLGTMLSAVFFEAANAAIPDLPKMFARGEFTPLRRWLVENVHAHGRRHRFRDLCRIVTGQELTADPLLAYLEAKLRPLHGI